MSNRVLNILVVDDDRGDRKSVIRSCEKSGLDCNVIEAEDMVGAERLLQRGDIDCVLIDYVLPGEDGLEGLRRIHTALPYLPIVMVTCRGDEIIAANALKAGAVNYVSKDHLGTLSLRDIIEDGISITETQQELDERRAELERFAAMLAHDLLSPVVHISNFIDIIEGDVEAKKYDNLPEHFSYVKKSAVNLIAFVKSISQYARVDAELEIREFDLRQPLDMALNMLAEKIREKNCRVIVDKLPSVKGDSGLLAQLFENLIANAIKFNSSAQPEVRISAERSDGYVRVLVTDNGIGISRADQSGIFTPFKRLHGKNEYDGSGLGLATVQRIVKRHGGRITLRSAPGDGTEFTIDLPLHE